MKEYIVKGRLEKKTGFMSFTVKKELIRCKDCKHYSIAENGVNGVCNELFVPFDANEWCSRAEPKESE